MSKYASKYANNYRPPGGNSPNRGGRSRLNNNRSHGPTTQRSQLGTQPRTQNVNRPGDRVLHSDVPPTAGQPLLMGPTLTGPNARAPTVFPQNIGVVPQAVPQQILAQNPAAGLPGQPFFLPQQPQFAAKQQPINLGMANAAQLGATSAPQQISGGMHTLPHMIASVNTGVGTMSQVHPTNTTSYRGVSMPMSRPSVQPATKRQSKTIKMIDPNTKKEVNMGGSKPETSQPAPSKTSTISTAPMPSGVVTFSAPPTGHVTGSVAQDFKRMVHERNITSGTSVQSPAVTSAYAASVPQQISGGMHTLPHMIASVNTGVGTMSQVPPTNTTSYRGVSMPMSRPSVQPATKRQSKAIKMIDSNTKKEVNMGGSKPETSQPAPSETSTISTAPMPSGVVTFSALPTGHVTGSVAQDFKRMVHERNVTSGTNVQSPAVTSAYAASAPQQISGGMHTLPHMIASVNTGVGTMSQVPPTNTTSYRGVSMPMSRPSVQPATKRQSKAIKMIDPNTKKEVNMGGSKLETSQPAPSKTSTISTAPMPSGVVTFSALPTGHVTGSVAQDFKRMVHERNVTSGTSVQSPAVTSAYKPPPPNAIITDLNKAGGVLTKIGVSEVSSSKPRLEEDLSAQQQQRQPLVNQPPTSTTPPTVSESAQKCRDEFRQKVLQSVNTTSVADEGKFAAQEVKNGGHESIASQNVGEEAPVPPAASGNTAQDEKDLENLEHYIAYEKALKDGHLTLRYLKFLFFGPPRSGKSSTRKRLLYEIVNLRSLGEPSVSTGVAEANDVIIKKLVSEPAAISSRSRWQSLRLTNVSSKDLYSEGELDYLTKLFYLLISKKTVPDSISKSATKLSHEKVHDHTSNTELSVQAPISVLKQKDKIEIESAFDKLTRVLQSDSPEDLQQLLEDLTMINMVDIGGQPAFLELFPALTIGHALYFIFFRLDQELETHYDVIFCTANGNNEKVHKESYCTEIVLYQSLSTIACFGSHSSPEYAESARQSGHALLFGTYKDQVKPERISEMDKVLQEKFVKTKLFDENLLLKTKNNKMFYSLDNMNGDESEMIPIRKDIEGIIDQLFPPTPIPASWLIFRMVLHYLHKPVVTLAHCKEIASRLSMPTPVEEAIWFFHHNIGSLMHFPEIPSMQDTVICDPQVVFDCVSELIIDTFKLGNRAIPQAAINAFHEKGQFSSTHIKGRTGCHGISLEQLVDTLKHLNILAEIKRTSKKRCDSQPKFVMPAVLKFATKKQLKFPTSSEVSPLIIHFEGGFVPFGVFCASAAHLIGHSPRWELCDDQMKRNKVTFIIDGAFKAMLISHPQCLKVMVSQQLGTWSKRSLEVMCSTVRQTLIETLESVISKMKYKPFVITQYSSKRPFDLAFTCQRDSCAKDHWMTFIEDKDGQRAKCFKTKLVLPLQKQHLIWFEPNEDTKSSSSATGISSSDEGQSVRKERSNEMGKNPRPKLDQELDFENEGVSRDLGTIADFMLEWEGSIAEHLDLTQADICAIQYRYPREFKMQARVALLTWKQRYGHRATYRNLIGAFERAGHQDYADKVRDLVCTHGYKCDGLTFSESMNPKEVVQWLVKEVGQSENPKILKLLTIFEENDVDGKNFLQLDDIKLRGEPFYVESWGLRMKIIEAVQKASGKSASGRASNW